MTPLATRPIALRASVGFALLLLTYGCSVDLTVGPDVVISCTSDENCPADYICHAVLAECVKVDSIDTTLIPRPVVTFVSPSNGQTGVTARPTIIVAFSMAVEGASLPTRISLATTATSSAVGLNMASTEEPNIFTFEPQTALASLTQYTLDVAVGIEPVSGNATSSAEPFSTSFETGQEPDTTPPSPVMDLLVDHRNDTLIELSWTNPSDADFAGVLLVRKSGGIIDVVPENGRTYAIGAFLDATQEVKVIASIFGTAWTDIDVQAGQYNYALFAFDTSSNYAPANRTPYMDSMSTTWCTNETGTFVVSTPDSVGGQQLEVNAIGGTLAGTGGLFPALPDPLGSTTMLFIDSVLTAGVEHYVRPILTSTTATYVGLEGRRWTSRQLLENSGQPADVPPGATGSFTFVPDGWTEFEGEFDDDPTVGVENWTSAGVTVQPGIVSAQVPITPGEYRFRVRPTRVGCPAAPWTVSAPFQTGSYMYVTVLGAGDRSGSDPLNAIDGIANALAAASAGTEIRVAEGTYNETSVSVAADLRLYGGYISDFSLRDPDTYLTELNVSSSTGLVFDGAAITNTTIVDGFDLRVTATGALTKAVTISNGASPTVSNNVIRTSSSTSDSDGIYITAGNPVIDGNTFIGPPNSATSRGLYVSGSGANPTIINNVIDTRVGAYFNLGGRGTFASNVVLPGSGGTSNAGAGLFCNGSGPVQIDNNVIAAGWGQTASLNYGLWINNCSAVDIVGNMVAAGGGSGTSAGIYLNSSTSVLVVNNVISAGRANTNNYAVDCTGTSPTFTNNTVHVGETGSNERFGIYEKSNCAMRVSNNVFFAEANGWEGIRKFGSNNNPPAVKNNAWLGGPAYLFNDGFTHQYSDVASMEAGLPSLGVQTGGNVLALTAATAFVDALGADFDINTLSDNDWHLVVTNTLLTEGGLDASQSNCAGSCGPVVVDLEEASRTVPYSIGAYEHD